MAKTEAIIGWEVVQLLPHETAGKGGGGEGGEGRVVFFRVKREDAQRLCDSIQKRPHHPNVRYEVRPRVTRIKRKNEE